MQLLMFICNVIHDGKICWGHLLSIIIWGSLVKEALNVFWQNSVYFCLKIKKIKSRQIKGILIIHLVRHSLKSFTS